MRIDDKFGTTVGIPKWFLDVIQWKWYLYESTKPYPESCLNTDKNRESLKKRERSDKEYKRNTA